MNDTISNWLRCFAILCLMTLTTAMSCDDDERYISVYNSSDQDIYYKIDYADVPLVPADFNVAPKKSEMIEYEDLRRLTTPNTRDSTMFHTLLIFEQSTIENHTWQEIQQQNLYDARYEIPSDSSYSDSNPIIYTGS